MLRDFLPTRYAIGPAFVVDHEGGLSEQIDVAIYDTHYSPQWFGTSGQTRFIPVESVYAIFEVKPDLNGTYLRSAQEKVASVRRIKRTSNAVIHKGGKYQRSEIDIKPILGGILSTRCSIVNLRDWLEKDNLREAAPNKFLDIGICLDECAFDYTPTESAGHVDSPLSVRQDQDCLIHFAIRLFSQLQAIGTVPAVEMNRYEASFNPQEQE
jgi:hypothetical protein